jgi:hypothetical protein
LKERQLKLEDNNRYINKKVNCITNLNEVLESKTIEYDNLQNSLQHKLDLKNK